MNNPGTGSTLADDLMIGAEAIAEFLYGDRDRTRDVYRNPAGFSFFKHGNSIAARRSTIRSELAVAEQAARERMRKLKDFPPNVALPGRARSSGKSRAGRRG